METVVVEEKLVLGVYGYPELYSMSLSVAITMISIRNSRSGNESSWDGA